MLLKWPCIYINYNFWNIQIKHKVAHSYALTTTFLAFLEYFL